MGFVGVTDDMWRQFLFSAQSLGHMVPLDQRMRHASLARPQANRTARQETADVFMMDDPKPAARIRFVPPADVPQKPAAKPGAKALAAVPDLPERPHAPGKVGGVAQTARPAARPVVPRMKRRYLAIIASFAILVIVPVAVVTVYMYTVAKDQYHSVAAFSIRSEEANAAVSGLLGALTQVSSGSANDPDILFEYIRSQDIVAELKREIDLSALFRKAPGDPVFNLTDDATIEDLYEKWMSMVNVTHESSNGILEVDARAFTPEDAQIIVAAIVRKSSNLVNELSRIANEDNIRFATDELRATENALYEVRRKLTAFRRTNQIVDPVADAQGQLGILTALQTELARALIEQDTLSSFAQPDDPRIASNDVRIAAISKRIDAERANLQGNATGTQLDIFSEYEDLLVQQEFAKASYTQALASLATANADARRQARYVAVHIEPTLAEQSLYPQREVIVALTALFAMLAWAVLALGYYNVRDNR
jgi:capsular polysaccharide transport system permease protein